MRCLRRTKIFKNKIFKVTQKSLKFFTLKILAIRYMHPRANTIVIYNWNTKVFTQYALCHLIINISYLFNCKYFQLSSLYNKDTIIRLMMYTWNITALYVERQTWPGLNKMPPAGINFVSMCLHSSMNNGFSKCPNTLEDKHQITTFNITDNNLSMLP